MADRKCKAKTFLLSAESTLGLFLPPKREMEYFVGCYVKKQPKFFITFIT